METKHNRTMLGLTSIVCLLPIVIALILYDELPEQIAIQWNHKGNPSNIAPKAFVAFGMPFFFMILNIFSKLRLYNDPKRDNIATAMKVLYTWLIPCLALVMIPISLFRATGANIPIEVIGPVITGIILIVVGNYLPKNRLNYAVGIRLPWTLHDSDNWNKTHRISGYLHILSGIILILASFLFYKNAAWLVIFFVVLVLTTVIPFLYSYVLYKKTGNKP